MNQKYDEEVYSSICRTVGKTAATTAVIAIGISLIALAVTLSKMAVIKLRTANAVRKANKENIKRANEALNTTRNEVDNENQS